MLRQVHNFLSRIAFDRDQVLIGRFQVWRIEYDTEPALLHGSLRPLESR